MRAARYLSWIIAGGIGIASAAGCDEQPAASAQTAAAAVSAAAASAEPRARPLPAFEGWTLEGERFQVASLLGRRALLFFFNPTVPEAEAAASAVSAVARLEREHNFRVVGVALASDPDTASAFVKRHELAIPVVDDSAGRVATRLGLRSPLALIGVDPEGNVSFALGGFAADPNATAVIEASLRESLRLPAADSGAEPVLGDRVRAPEFRAEPIDGGEPVELASLRGRPVVLIFFLHTCPHCHSALEFLRAEFDPMPEAQRPHLIGVSVSNRAYAVRETLREDGLDFFPVVLDPEYQIRNAYGVVAGVPDLFLIDREGFVVARNQGWQEERDPALMRMRLAKVAGLPIPMLLRPAGYSGNDACGICHQAEYETWLLTQHASAFDTLVRHGAERNDECIGCHVVGYGHAGGYSEAIPNPHLENVGCETCHGRGGPHLTPHPVSNGSLESSCLSCHDQKHSLGFEYAKFLPRVSHQANADLRSLSLEEKRRLLQERRRPRNDLLPTAAAYVGSEACRSCHEAEFETWAKSPHGRALDSLERKGEANNAECLRCHTTGFGRPGGFPSSAQPAGHPDLARVGCESCHGPGGDHIGENAPRFGTIVSLGDKCDSCVILQICGACHDEANDPEFEFAVQERIEAQRHGTIEPGTGKPKDRSAFHDAAVIEMAFSLRARDG